MGCLQSKNNKDKLKPSKLPKHSLGEFNTRWQRLLLQKTIQSLIIDQIPSTASHPAFFSIDKDVSRTFPDEKFFLIPANVELFKQVLKCFALTFPKVGYTQGLNFLCGYFLLSKMQKLQCLTTLSSVVVHPSLMFLGLYQDGFPLAELYCQMFWKILNKLDNQLYDCLKEIGISDHMWIFQWYLTFFLYSFPVEYVSLYINDLFEHKEFQMVKISLGIVLCMKQDILGLQEKDDVALLEYLQNLKDFQRCMRMVDVQISVKKAHSIKNSLINECLQQLQTSNKIPNNFYLTYFCNPQANRLPFHNKFLQNLQSTKVQLQQSKHDEKLLQSYKRNRSTVQILDEILIQSIKKQMEKKYKSSLFENRKQQKTVIHSHVRKWKSLAHIEEEPPVQGQPEGETTVSIVRKMDISQESGE